jgi:small subunit ribosomal protein S16
LIRFRVVAADSRSPRDGRCLEILGHYDPSKTSGDKMVIDKERVEYWLGKGAQPSETLWPHFRKLGIKKSDATAIRRKLSAPKA